MTAEAAVVRASVKALDAHGAVHFNIGASNGETGLPDRHALYRGRALYLEFKRPRGGAVSAKQRWWLDRLAAAGGVSLVVTDAEQVRAALRRIDEEDEMRRRQAA